MEENDNNNIRLSKRMAQLGLCSRREADSFIERGWVKVNGQIAVLGQKVLPGERIELARELHQQQAMQVTIILNKPVGYVSAQAEHGYKPAISLITPENRWEEDKNRLSFSHKHLKGLAPTGRLDIESTGLLILTQDGRLAKQIIGEDSDIEKEYLVRVEGTLIQDGLKLLNHGLSLDGKTLQPAQVVWQNQDQLKFILKEGKKRQIRRMCELVGLKVTGLKRVRIGQLKLGALPQGQWRYLSATEKI
jgi:23S rRNA pseudouridine2604 synthase